MPAYTSLSDEEVTDLVDYLSSLKSGTVQALEQAPDISNKPSVPRQSSPPPANVPAETRETVSAAHMQAGPAADIIGSAERGAVLFKMECASCHGADGTGKVPNPGSAEGTVPSLNPVDRELFSKEPEVFARNIDRFIQHGSLPEGAGPRLLMPAFGDDNSLTQQQIANAEAYILQLNGVNRAQLENPGLPPERFFMIVVPGVILVLLILGGIYKCLP
jgi:mono/diheme cytochrome c family protein